MGATWRGVELLFFFFVCAFMNFLHFPPNGGSFFIIRKNDKIFFPPNSVPDSGLTCLKP